MVTGFLSLRKRSLHAAVLWLPCTLVIALAANEWRATAAGSDALESAGDTPTDVRAFDAIAEKASRSSRECTSIAAIRWLPHSPLNIAYSRGDFTDAERTAFHQAVSSWQQALAQVSLGIVLAESGEVDAGAEPVKSQVIVKRENSMDSRHYGQIAARARADEYFDRGFILINGSIHKQDTLRKTMLHELGHAFGLRDCADCRSGATVMNYFSQQSVMGLKIRKASTRISDEPTACDISQVNSGYEESRPPSLKNDATESEITRTIVADEIVAPDTESSESPDNIIAPYLKPTQKQQAGLVAIGGARPEGMLTDAEKTEFDTYLPALLGREAETMEELNNYTFRREVRIQTIDSRGRVSGEYHRISDLLFDDSGRRTERGLALTKSTLRRLTISPEYVEDFSSAQLKGFELSKRDHYRIEPAMGETIDGIGMRVYRITPLNLSAVRAAQTRVFYGYVWVDARTSKIVKIGGCALPDDKQRYPLFETQRALVDGVHLFPARTIADDYLVFPSHTVHIRMLITYTNYKRFASRVRIIEIEN